MANIFCSIVEADCQEIKSSLNEEDGLLEITTPKNYTDEDLSEYFNSLSEEELIEIADKQKKTLKVFRKKVEKMIDKYKKEFSLPLYIKLRLQNNTKKPNDCNLQEHGIDFHGNLSISSVWQYFPDELVEKVIRGSICKLACQYENRWSQIKVMYSGIFEFPDVGTESKEVYAIPEAEKYHISVPDSEIENINADYETARNHFREDCDKRRIDYMEVF